MSSIPITGSWSTKAIKEAKHYGQIDELDGLDIEEAIKYVTKHKSLEGYKA